MGNFISYYMNSSFAQQQLYDYIKVTDAENQTDNANFANDIKEDLIDAKLVLNNNPKHYNLFIYIDSVSQELKDLYVNSAYKHNLVVENYLQALINNQPFMEKYCFNAGFDLFCPEDTESIVGQKVVLDHKIKSCMRLVGENNQFVSYYLYSRSSLPLKTPLRLANNVGIIDSGYRGNIKGIFDNLDSYGYTDFIIEFGTRLLQICPPNLEYPMKIIIVDNLSHLGETERGEGGFGSTGN